MFGLRPLWLYATLLFYRRAHREICPLHPDVGRVMQRRNDLEFEWRRRSA
jgi:hypothetical protein